MSLAAGARATLPQPLRRLGVWAWIIVGAVALPLFVLGITITPALYDAPFPIALVASLVLAGTIVLAVVRPKTAAVLHVVAVVVIAAISTRAPWPWPAPVVSILALCATLLVLSLAARWWVALATWVVACLALTVVATEVGATRDSSIANLIVAASISFGVLAIGMLLALWARANVDLGEARAEAEHEHAARAWAEERQRVAREMHDVVAHSMSLVHMRATSARYRIPDLPEAAIAELDGIALQARTALGEMRGVLGVLRGDDAAQLAPQPGLANLADLVASARDADVTIESRIDDVDPAPADTVQLALYRVAQEAIANVARHAPGASATLTLEAGERLTLTVTSTGGTPQPAPDRGGTGIRGMIDRMTAIGGSLLAGPIADGFQIVAIAPREPA